MTKLNQKGFGIGEILLLLLVLILLILAGWWTWKQKANNKPANSPTPAQTSEKPAEKPVEKPQETPKKYLEIKEFSVKLELDAATDDAYYLMKNGYAYISLSALKNVDECAAEKTGMVAVSQNNKTDVEEQSGKTYEALIQAGGSGAIVGNKAYLMNRSQAYCSENLDTQTKQQAAWNSFLAKAKTIQAL